MYEYKIKYIERQLKEREIWETKLTLAIAQENSLLCAFYRDKISSIDLKISKVGQKPPI